MSTIALPEFMARTSLKKPLDQAATFTISQGAQPVASAGALRQPQYRIRFASPTPAHRVPAHPAPTRPAPETASRDQSSLSTSSALAQKPAVATAPRGFAGPGHTKGVKYQKIRLTRRGRLVFRGLPLLTMLALVVLGALTLLAPGEAKSATADSVTPVSRTVTVVHGDTLWTIAADVAPEEDNRDVITRIMKINDLTSAQLVPGQTLEVPLYHQGR
ncbi:LysM peptidoglycan-binding domain-containing protein [Rothia sp. 32237D007AR]